MVVKCLKALKGALSVVVLAIAVTPGVMVFGEQKAEIKPDISFDELDAAEARTKKSKAKSEETLESEPANSPDVSEQEDTKPKKQLLPSVDQLIEAKLSALKARQEEQEAMLASVEVRLQEEQAIEKTTFDHNAYVAVSMINSAPHLDYRLDGSEIYIDGKLIARGGKRNQGLPRQREVFFAPVMPGCHQVVVKAKYTRLRNDLISRFKVNRVEHITESQAFIAQNGHRVEIEIQGYEKHNSLADWFRGPAIRFNKSARPNFLPGAPIISMDDVLKQGQVKIDYITEDQSNHRLLKKSLRIDGLPILVDEQHNEARDGNVVFNAPLREGKHTLNVTLLFGEKKWIQGGPSYNFRLSFDRDFYVISGQTTVVNLVGMPKGGIKSNSENSRYAKASSKILSEEYREFFPEMSCQEIADKEVEAQKKAAEALKKQQKEQQKPQQPAVVEPTPVETEPPVVPAEEIKPPEESRNNVIEGSEVNAQAHVEQPQPDASLVEGE